VSKFGLLEIVQPVSYVMIISPPKISAKAPGMELEGFIAVISGSSCILSSFIGPCPSLITW
jgi:hypothetical protein